MKYIQILFYYIQDASLFKVYLDHEGQDDEHVFIKFLKFSPEVIKTLMSKVTNLCFSSDSNAVTKVLFRSLFGPSVMVFFLILYLLQTTFVTFWCKNSKFLKSMKAKLVQAFLLALLFSYQHIVAGAFTLVKCVEIYSLYVLYIKADIECYTWWQIAIKLYIFLSIIPAFFVLSHTPYYIQDRKMPVQTFILACVCPLPVLIAYHIIKLFERRKKKKAEATGADMAAFLELLSLRQDSAQIRSSSVSSSGKETIVSEQNQIRVSHKTRETLSTIDFFFHLSSQDNEIKNAESPDRSVSSEEHSSTNDEEIQDDTAIVVIEKHMIEKSQRHTESEEEILNTLLKHYKCLDIFGVRFTWLGIHKLYRVVLVICNTYITDPFTRLCLMTSVLLPLSIVNVFVKPYKETKTNVTATLSYAATLIVAFLNFGKTFLVKFGCDTNCSGVTIVLRSFEHCERALLVYVPIVALTVWVVYIVIQKCCCKEKY